MGEQTSTLRGRKPHENTHRRGLGIRRGVDPSHASGPSQRSRYRRVRSRWENRLRRYAGESRMRTHIVADSEFGGALIRRMLRDLPNVAVTGAEELDGRTDFDVTREKAA